MTQKNLFLACLSLSMLLFSCKKEVITPEPVIKTVYVHDTTIVTQAGDTVIVTIHDTIYITTNPPALIGQWNLTHWTQQQNGGTISTNNTPGYTWTFMSTDVVMNLGGTIYTYPVIYNTGYVTMTQAGNNYDYSYSYNAGTQVYTLTKTQVSGSNIIVSKYYLHQ